MRLDNLREWMKKVESFGELKKINGADWNLELGGINEVYHTACRRKGKTAPVLLFDEIKGYPPGYRVLTNSLSSVKRIALTLGIESTDLNKLEFINAVREKLKNVVPVAPKYVSTGPVMENIDEGEHVDLLKFPAPFWHEHDGGRYIGTGCLVITKDPDEGWVNLGTYRVMLHDKSTMAFYISPGKHGRIHREKYFQRNKPCRVTVIVGPGPLSFMLSGKEIDYGVSEFDYAGGIQGEPVELIQGDNGLPIPASAEIAIEGEAIPGELAREGPFGEWTGYYGSSAREEPVIRVKRVLYRNQPILVGAPPSKPPNENSFYSCILRSALIWNEVERNGIPDLQGIFCHDPGAHRLFVVISIKQRYSGHAKQAALITSQCHAAAYLGRYIIVVDEDIDISSLDDVVWAMCTRTDPEYDIDIVRRCWSGPLDPIVPAGRKGFSSRAIVDACKPYERLDTFPRVAQVSPEMRRNILKKWAPIFRE